MKKYPQKPHVVGNSSVLKPTTELLREHMLGVCLNKVTVLKPQNYAEYFKLVPLRKTCEHLVLIIISSNGFLVYSHKNCTKEKQPFADILQRVASKSFTKFTQNAEASS